ncbi:MAG: hypothetical protein RQ723_09945 [Desulfuromonadales bacterium]|nr:hypothetical protein [Desulfuromonadales bacterium]
MFELLMLAGLMGAALSTLLPETGTQRRGSRRRRAENRDKPPRRKGDARPSRPRGLAQRVQTSNLTA